MASAGTAARNPSRRYFIALGANLGNRDEALTSAWRMLADSCRTVRLSRLYESRPMYVLDQPPYLNAVGELFSTLLPAEMLDNLHGIETALGRDRARERRMGPRTIDLDILLCDDIVMMSPLLVIPHPRMEERFFVLIPLLEIAPDLRVPGTGIPYARKLAALDAERGSDDRGVYLYHPR